MVSTTSIIFMIFTTLVTIFMPVAIAIIFYKKTKYKRRSLIAGVVVFTVMQMFIRMPIIQILLPKMEWYQSMTKNIWIYAIFLGLTAGIFEEVGRYIAFKTVLAKNLEWKNGVAFGIGHGGIESILIVGLTYLSNLYMSFMINSGMFETIIAPTIPKDIANQLKDQLLDLPSYIFLIPSVERPLTFIIQIAFSVLLMLGIQKRKDFLYLTIAVLLHMIIDALAVILSANGVNLFIIEGIVLIFTIIAIIFLVKTGKGESEKVQERI